MELALIKSLITPPVFSVTPAAVAQRDALVLALRKITQVLNPAEQATATNLAVQARRFLKDVESTRKDTTKPFRDFTAQVKALADSLTPTVEQEMNRVGRLVALFQQQEAERVRQENEKRQEEIRRAQAEQQEAERRRREAEAAIHNEEQLAAAIAAEAAANQSAAEARAVITAPEPAPIKARGSATQNVMRWEVIDIHALYRARPELVRLEPNASAIRALVSANGPQIPGLKVWEELTTTFRAR